MLVCARAANRLRALPRTHSSVQELSDWRGRVAQQVESYRSELSGLQAHLTEEMAGLRGDLAGVKATIRSQLEASEAALGELRCTGSADPPTHAAPAAPQASCGGLSGVA